MLQPQHDGIFLWCCFHDRMLDIDYHLSQPHLQWLIQEVPSPADHETEEVCAHGDVPSRVGLATQETTLGGGCWVQEVVSNTNGSGGIIGDSSLAEGTSLGSGQRTDEVTETTQSTSTVLLTAPVMDRM